MVELTREVAYRIEEGPTGLRVVLERAEGARAGTTKLEAPKPPEVPRSTQVPKLAEAPRSDGRTVSPARLDTPTAEATKPVAPKPETPRTEMVKPVAPTPSAKPEPVATAAVVVPNPPAPTRVAQASPGAAPAPPAARPEMTPSGSKLITLDFKEADVVNVLRILSAEAGRNIAVGDDVKGKVTVSLRNVTWEQALDTILEARGLQKIEKGGVIRIVSSEQLAKEREAQARAEEAKRKAEIDNRTKMAEAQLKEQEAQQRRLALEAAAIEAVARGPLAEEVIRLSYADAGEVGNTLQGVLGLGVEPILPCRTVQGGQGTGGGGGSSSPVNGPIAAPPFSQLFGPPPAPTAAPTPPRRRRTSSPTG